MLMFSLTFLLGDLFLQQHSLLPKGWVLFLAGAAGVTLMLLRTSRFYCIAIAGFFIGFAWAGWAAYAMQERLLLHELEGKPVMLRGVIQSLPVKDSFGMHFLFTAESLQFAGQRITCNYLVRLSWVQAPPLNVGDVYHLYVRLRRIHGMRNPDGFDYEAWSHQNGIAASGSIITQMPVKYLGHRVLHAPVNQIRQKLQQRIAEHLPASKTSHWLFALMIGERSAVQPDQWQILRATGTNHLMAIAGLHIGLISGLMHALVQFFWRRSRYLTTKYPAQLAAAVAALITAWIYSALAGFSIPTQRACVMVSFFILALLARRQLPAWHAWCASLLTVLVLNPASVLSESFWLSFGTIALIIFGMSGRLAPRGLWWKWGRVQWVIGLGLLPLSLLFFQQTSLVSVVANSIAIPWLGLFILPFCMLSEFFLFICPGLGGFFLQAADMSLSLLWLLLEWFAQLDYAVWMHSMPSLWLLIITVIACLMLLLPAGMPARWLGIIWLLPIYFFQSRTPELNDFWVTTLDVGQGLSVIVQTRSHTLIYDAGPSLGSQFDTGESVVLPYLHYAGIKQIDNMIISHGDNDHIGGAGAVIRNINVKKVLTSAVEKLQYFPAQLCLAGMSWQWDGVAFNMIYPTLESLQLGNDSSCVLRIDNGRHSVLLTGDIEKFAERQLLSSGTNLTADILTAPHHGSKTSSQKDFITAVHPQYVIFATGYRNRYHFPHVQVVTNYQDKNVMMINTVDAGAVQFRLEKNSQWIKPRLYRMDNHHYWND